MCICANICSHDWVVPSNSQSILPDSDHSPPESNDPPPDIDSVPDIENYHEKMPYRVHDYVFINGIDRKGRKKLWVGKVLEVIEGTIDVRVQWAYNPSDLPTTVKRKYKFGKKEILMAADPTDSEVLDICTLMGRVQVIEYAWKSYRNILYWNRLFDRRSNAVTDAFVGEVRYSKHKYIGAWADKHPGVIFKPKTGEGGATSSS